MNRPTVDRATAQRALRCTAQTGYKPAQPHKWGAMLRLYVSVGVWGFGYLLRLWLRETAAPKNFPRLAAGSRFCKKWLQNSPGKIKTIPVYRTRFTTPLTFSLQSTFPQEAFCKRRMVRSPAASPTSSGTLHVPVKGHSIYVS